MSNDPFGRADVKAMLGELNDAIRRLHIDLPDQCSAVKRAHALVDRSPLTPSQILAIESGASMGKTRVLDIISGHIRSAYVPQVEGWTCRVTCSSTSCGSSLGRKLCDELRVPAIGLGSLPRMGDYVTRQIGIRRPVLLAIDNAHLLVDRGTPDETATAFLGTILASGAVPVILAGRTGTFTLAKRLVGIVGQIIEMIELSPIPYTRGSDLNRTRDFLLVVDGVLFPLLDRIGISMTLGTDDLAKRFWGATWGSPGGIMALILESLRVIIESRADRRDNSRYFVTRADFAEAWRLQFAWQSPLTFNPFMRDDGPTLGEIQLARKAEEQRKQKQEALVRLPATPKGKGAVIWR